MARHLADAPGSLHLPLARAMAALQMGAPYHASAEWDAAERTTTVTVVVHVSDRAVADGAFDSLEEAFMQELQDDEMPKTVERPSPMQINVGGVSNLQVKWDKQNGCFRLTSVCVICGRAFERTMRGFVTRDLITAAHDLGYTIGEHCERHRSFGDHLRELQQQEKEGDTHKPT